MSSWRYSETFDPDEKIVLTNSGYVTIYGPLTYDHITDHGAMDDEDEDEGW